MNQIRMNPLNALVLMGVVSLTSCGGGGGGSSDNATPAPAVTVSVSPSTITVAQSSTLTWSSTNATSCTASGAWSGNKATVGSQLISPSAAGTYTYALACTGAGGNASNTATLTVNAATPAPTVSISVAPATITVGQNSTLTWSATNATSCTASGAWSGSKATSGTQSVSPSPAGSYTYTLSCTGAGGNASNSTTLTVDATSSAVPNRLAFTVEPAGTAAGQAISVQVAIQDGEGNTVPDATNAISMAIGANPGNATLGGTTTVNAVNGVATFSDLTIIRSGDGYTLTASASNLTGDTSLQFNIIPGSASHLSLDVPPPSKYLERLVIGPPIQVTVRDAYDNTVSAANTPISVTIGTGPNGPCVGYAVLSGTSTVDTIAGTASFSDLGFNFGDNVHSVSCSMTFTASGLTSASSDVLVYGLSATGLSLEGNGTSALATIGGGFLVRIDLASLAVTQIIQPNLVNTTRSAVAVEAGGTTALVTDYRRLIRVNTVTGATAVLATGFNYAGGIAIESGGATALVADETSGVGGRLLRVTLATGAIQEITHDLLGDPRGVAIEAGGTTALVMDSNLYRVDLSSGTVSVVSTGHESGSNYYSTFGGELAIEAGGATVLALASGKLVRVDLATGDLNILGRNINDYGAGAFVLESGGNTVLFGGDTRVIRSFLSGSITTISLGITQTAVDVVIEAGGTTALVAEAGGFSGTPRLLRVDLVTGAVTTLATFPFFAIYAVALEPGGNTALITADGKYLLRVDLATGSVTTITSLLSNIFGGQIRIEFGGATALVGGGSLFRVNLSSGAVTVVASSNAGASGLAIEAGETAALVTALDGTYVRRVDLSTGAVTDVATELGTYVRAECGGLAIEQGGHTVLLSQPGDVSSGGGRILRINLETGAVTVIVPIGLSGTGQYTCGVGGIAIESGGATALVADEGHGLVRIAVPAP